MTYLGFMEVLSKPMFNDQIFKQYFKTCNVAPIWKQLTEWGWYNQETDEGYGFSANV